MRKCHRTHISSLKYTDIYKIRLILRREWKNKKNKWKSLYMYYINVGLVVKQVSVCRYLSLIHVRTTPKKPRKLMRVHARRTSSGRFQTNDSLSFLLLIRLSPYSVLPHLFFLSHICIYMYSELGLTAWTWGCEKVTESAAEMKDLIYLPVSHNSLSIGICT